MWEVKDVSKATKMAVVGGRVSPQERLGVVLHTTDGVDSLAWLQGGSANGGSGASADYLVLRRGDILKLMPRGYHAFHAGVTNLSGSKDPLNHVSRRYIGIEVENLDSKGQVPTGPQHEATAGLIAFVADVYRFSPLRVYGHYGLAYPMGRRSDPHAWDWGLMFWLMAHAKERITLIGNTGSIIAEGGV
jgi:N-acetyl-anhydromuramyl-L-alanine amidase AmpD